MLSLLNIYFGGGIVRELWKSGLLFFKETESGCVCDFLTEFCKPSSERRDYL